MHVPAAWQDRLMVNLFEAEFQYDDEDPEGYRCGAAFVGRDAGGTANAVKLYQIPPGQSLCPYHYEYEEEWLLVLDGDLVLRTPEDEQMIGRGALVCFPAGPDGAHKLTNRAGAPAHVLMFSSAREPAVAVYPDSDKIGVFPPDARDRLMVRRANGQEDYYAGEV
ncbi:MAG TPA: cupin domain-containing protein [Solirubrobacteraceae bacterium]|nr:cupin domain-containing protein [Solirubrobacteraceae bacterium]